MKIGRQHSPAESCGLLVCGLPGLPYALLGVQNSSLTPEDETVMAGADVSEALCSLERHLGPMENWMDRLVVWHTHPGGRVGPSRMDMIFRKTLGAARCLVVTLPGGEATMF